MIQHYDLVIIGATFSGIGAALAHKHHVLIIERRPTLGTEFINCYNPGKKLDNEDVCSCAKEFRDKLKNLKLLKGDVLRIASVSPVIYDFIKDKGIPILLQTDVISVHRTSDEFDVEFYNTEGFNKIRTKKVLDTTPINITNKYINAVISGGETLPENFGKATLFESPFKKEGILKLPVDKNASYSDARAELHILWEKRPEKYQNWTISAVGDYFEYTCSFGPSESADGCIHLPSCAYNNIFDALSAGYCYERGEK